MKDLNCIYEGDKINCTAAEFPIIFTKLVVEQIQDRIEFYEIKSNDQMCSIKFLFKGAGKTKELVRQIHRNALDCFDDNFLKSVLDPIIYKAYHKNRKSDDMYTVYTDYSSSNIDVARYIRIKPYGGNYESSFVQASGWSMAPKRTWFFKFPIAYYEKYQGEIESIFSKYI